MANQGIAHYSNRLGGPALCGNRNAFSCVTIDNTMGYQICKRCQAKADKRKPKTEAQREAQRDADIAAAMRLAECYRICSEQHGKGQNMRLDYKNMKLESNGNPDKPIVKVFKNSCFLRPLFVTTSLDLAMRWIDAQTGE